MKRYPSLPCVDAALCETVSKFGIDPHAKQITAEDREIASNFDVRTAIKTAETAMCTSFYSGRLRRMYDL